MPLEPLEISSSWIKCSRILEFFAPILMEDLSFSGRNLIKTISFNQVFNVLIKWQININSCAILCSKNKFLCDDELKKLNFNGHKV